MTDHGDFEAPLRRNPDGSVPHRLRRGLRRQEGAAAPPPTAAHRILGVDPGLGGALALLDSLGELTVVDMPTVSIERGGKTKREVDIAALVAAIREMAPSHVVLERVGARPGQGVSSMFAFGRGVGQIEGVIAACGVPVSYVTPPTWRRALSVPPGKDGSRLRGAQLLPRYAERWRRARDDGRSEASLIALWGLLHVPLLTSGGEAA